MTQESQNTSLTLEMSLRSTEISSHQPSFSSVNLVNSYRSWMDSYLTKTPTKLRIIDIFCSLCLLLTIIPAVYSFIIGKFIINALLSGIFAPLGTLIFTACLRFQLSKESGLSRANEQRTFIEYLVCMAVFYISVINFLG